MPYWGISACRAPLVGGLITRGLNAFVLGAACKGSVHKLSPEVRHGFVGPYNSWENRVAISRFVCDIPMKPGDVSRELLQSIDDNLHQLKAVPMRIFWGMQDFVSHPLFGRMENASPKSR